MNPNHPEEALLHRPYWLAVWTAWLGFFMSLAMLVGGVFMFWSIVKPTTHPS